jgi:hypothetical protein
VELQHGFALVEFDALHEEEPPNTLLREWFPLPGPGPAADPVAGAAAARGHHFHTDLTNMVRPKPPQEVSSGKSFFRAFWGLCLVLVLSRVQTPRLLLREWFPLPGPGPAADPVAAAAAALGHHSHTQT